MTTALMYLDDSSGILGHDLREMLSLYGRACAAAPPNRAALATWLGGYDVRRIARRTGRSRRSAGPVVALPRRETTRRYLG